MALHRPRRSTRYIFLGDLNDPALVPLRPGDEEAIGSRAGAHRDADPRDGLVATFQLDDLFVFAHLQLPPLYTYP